MYIYLRRVMVCKMRVRGSEVIWKGWGYGNRRASNKAVETCATDKQEEEFGERRMASPGKEVRMEVDHSNGL
jgi:hypothetical protein